MRRNNSHPFDIFDKKDVRFRRFHGTMETTYQNLHKEGVGVEIRHASIISEVEEAILWEWQILGCHSPSGKSFCLRGGKEHRELKLSQFQRDNNHWKYTEYGSKNFCGGLADLRRENKVVRQFACPTAGDHFHVRLLDFYVSKLPKGAEKKDAFYFTPKTPEDPEKPWYSAVPIGWNKLVKDIFAEANISGKTNHSLRATGATRMYNNGIPEKTIQVRTGHKSINGLRVYECPGLEQQREACEALADVTNKQVVPKSSELDVSHQNIVAPTVHRPTFPPVQLANSGAPILPPSFTFSGCSVNVCTGLVMTSGTFQSSSTPFGLSQADIDNFSKF